MATYIKVRFDENIVALDQPGGTTTERESWLVVRTDSTPPVVYCRLIAEATADKVVNALNAQGT